ncbi:UNVERIFIED_CONTAM: hypothetical protein PYX00_004346 [Menopon gallinae]|uniref:non-specific serine/threonine protein kinase n=1 Tax=Menopon gallinae TaxID=328185 RepID=A0AAW2I3D3_9NEOP
MDRKTEIRKLPPSAILKLSQLLDLGNAWQEVMAVIPEDPNDQNSPPKYTLEHMKLIQSAGEKHNRSYTEILLDEWGTSGKVRPTVMTLLEVLLKAQFFRAADFVAVELLHDDPPSRPSDGPAAPVHFNLDTASTAVLEAVPDTGNRSDIAHIPFAVLQEITNNFDETPLTYINSDGVFQRIGHKLGTGAFGTVYYGQMSNGRNVAVKKLAADAITLKKQFENEIVTLSEYRHENLVPLLGFSCDTYNYCLVYEFMCNGSLLDRLQLKKTCKETSDTNLLLNGMASNMISPTGQPLGWKKRMEIAVEVAKGIHYLHTYKSTPLIHRDIKTANVLLDEQLRAKLGDFGLVKVKPNASDTKLITSTVFGTSAYMAPEAFRGDVSVKIDVFSFGVILLELLTGLPPYDENREGCDLVTYIEEVVDDKIGFLLDEKAGNWPESCSPGYLRAVAGMSAGKAKASSHGECSESVRNTRD